jgi:hypothetical protein
LSNRSRPRRAFTSAGLGPIKPSRSSRSMADDDDVILVPQVTLVEDLPEAAVSI